MPTPSDTIDPTELLRHADWMRALAARLVLDGDRADDVVQETWHAVLRRPPGPDVPRRAWLSGVVRKIAAMGDRGAGRRRRREAAMARRDESPSAAEVAERAELQQRVLAEVNALPAPMRDVLLLRYYDGLPPRRIAARLGLPVNTVRTRQQRALAQLRTRLDRSFGDRRTWALGLVPLLRRRDALAAVGTPWLGLGVLFMIHKTKILVAAATTAAALTLTYFSPWAPRPVEDLRQWTPAADALTARASSSNGALARHSTAAPARRARIDTPDRAAPAAQPAAQLNGKIVDTGGRPVEGAEIHMWSRDWLEAKIATGEIRREDWVTKSAADGTFALPRPGGDRCVLGEPLHPEFVADKERTEWAPGERAEIVMRPTRTVQLEVEVVDETTGMPVPRFLVTAVTFWNRPEDGERFPDPIRSLAQPSRSEARHGRYTCAVRFVEDEPLLVRLQCWGHGRGEYGDGSDHRQLERQVEAPAGNVLRLRFVADLGGAERAAPGNVVRGRVVDAENDRPLDGIVLRMTVPGRQRETTRTVQSRADGSFVVARPKDGARGRLLAEHPAYQTEEVEDPGPGAVVVRMRRRGSLECTVLDRDGKPMAGVPFLFRTHGRRRHERGRTDAAGKLRFDGLLADRYHVYLLRNDLDADENALAHRSFAVEPGVDAARTWIVDPPDRVVVQGVVTSAAPLPHRMLPLFLPYEADAGWVRSRPHGLIGYTAGGLARGRYLVVLQPEDDGDPEAPIAFLPGIEITGFGTRILDLQFPTHTLHGRIDAPPAMLRDARIVALPTVPTQGAAAEALASEKATERLGVAPAADGSFALRHLAPGAHELQLRRGPDVLARRPVDVTATADIGTWRVE